MSRLKAPWQNGPYKNKHTEQHKNMQNTKTQQTFRRSCFCFVFRILYFFIYDFLNEFSRKVKLYHLGSPYRQLTWIVDDLARLRHVYALDLLR